MDDDRLGAELALAAVADREYVARVYRLVLRRTPETEACDRAVGKLGNGTLSRATLLAELVDSDEFARVRELDDAVAFAAWARGAGERPRQLRGRAESDERAIEIPWALARYRGEPRVLDVGYAFAEPAYVAALVRASPRPPVGVDLAEAAVPGLEPLRADVRSLPLGDGSFDVAFCISTLEHVGSDNTVYGVEAGRDDAGMERALRELRRVLAPGGRLLVTVPCGERERHDWFVQLDEAGWLDLFASAGFLVFEHEVYRRAAAGWQSVSGRFDPAGVRYGVPGPGASAVLCAELHPATLTRRAREAVRRARR